MKKAYTFRLDPALINAVDQLPGNRTLHLTQALQQYCLPQSDKQYTVDVVSILQDQVHVLQGEKQHMQQQIDFYMLPWYLRVLYRKRMLELLPEHKKD